MGIFPKDRGEHKQYLKPPPSFSWFPIVLKFNNLRSFGLVLAAGVTPPAPQRPPAVNDWLHGPSNCSGYISSSPSKPPTYTEQPSGYLATRCDDDDDDDDHDDGDDDDDDDDDDTYIF